MEQGPPQPSEKGCHGNRRGARSPQKRPMEQQAREYRRKHYRRGQNLGDLWTQQNARQGGTHQPPGAPKVSAGFLSSEPSGQWGQWSAGCRPGGRGLFGATDMVKEEGARLHPADGWELPVLAGELAGLGGLPCQDSVKVNNRPNRRSFLHWKIWNREQFALSMHLLLVWKGWGRELPNRARSVVISMNNSLKLKHRIPAPRESRNTWRLRD